MGDIILGVVFLIGLYLVWFGRRQKHEPTVEEIQRAEDTALRQWYPRNEPPGWV